MEIADTNQKIIFGLFLILLSLINLVSAISCTQSSIIVNYTQGQTLDKLISCSNPDNNSVSITKAGDFFSFTPNTIASATTQMITLTFSGGNIGVNSGILMIGSLNIPITANVTEIQLPDVSECKIDIFPTIFTNVKVVQGEKKTRNIQLSIPYCYKSSVSVNGVILQNDEKPITLGELNMGVLNPGDSLLLPIEIVSTGVSTGQYSDTLQFLLYDNKGIKINVPSVSISVLVSAGIQPISNFSLSDLPTCSLDAIEMNLNSSYKLTCSVNNPNIEVKPLIDAKFIKGLKVQETSSQYIYEFKPILIGYTIINAEFLYKNAPLGTPFSQEIRITSSGITPVSGITIIPQFFQSGIERKADNLVIGTVVIMAIDNKTGNLIMPFNLYIDGIFINKTSLELESGKVYNIRITAPGYNDLVISNITIKQTQTSFSVEPLKDFYLIGEEINLSSPENCSFLVDDAIIDKLYSLNSVGKITINCVKESYLTSNKTVDVRTSITYTTLSPLFDEWKKGKKVLAELNENVSWQVYLTEEGSTEKILKNTGEGNLVGFTIDDYGYWEIKTGETLILGKQIIKNTFNINWKGYTSWIVLGIIVIGVGWYFIRMKGGKPSKEAKFSFGEKKASV